MGAPLVLSLWMKTETPEKPLPNTSLMLPGIRVTSPSTLATHLFQLLPKSCHLTLWQILAGLATYLGIMLFVLRPVFRILAARHEGTTIPDKIIAALLVFMLASSWATEWLGIHALFGAFFAGMMMPKDKRLAEDLLKRIHPLVVVLLIPLFFAFTGLRTSIGLISGSKILSEAKLLPKIKWLASDS
jgi:Kef-type K+ transport system membrane component KefB